MALIAKSSLYLLFVYRLKISFQDSAYSYNNKLLSFISFTLIIHCIIFTIATAMWVKGSKEYLIDYFNENTSQEKEYYWCSYVVPYFTVIPYIVSDIMYNILLSILFVKPIIVLHSTMNERELESNHKNNSNDDSGLQRLAIKTSIIVLVTCISSLIILIILVFTGWGVVVAIDWTINSFCVILMLQHYDKLYKKCC